MLRNFSGAMGIYEGVVMFQYRKRYSMLRNLLVVSPVSFSRKSFNTASGILRCATLCLESLATLGLPDHFLETSPQKWLLGVILVIQRPIICYLPHPLTPHDC